MWIKYKNTFNKNKFVELPNKRNKAKAIYSTNSTINKGFLEVNITFKGKFYYYDYVSIIKVYKNFFKDILYIPIKGKNYIILQKLISNEEYLYEDGV